MGGFRAEAGELTALLEKILLKKAKPHLEMYDSPKEKSKTKYFTEHFAGGYENRWEEY